MLPDPLFFRCIFSGRRLRRCPPQVENSALAQWFRARTENARGTRKLMIVVLNPSRLEIGTTSAPPAMIPRNRSAHSSNASRFTCS